MYCKECGVENKFDTGNCLECGAELTEPNFAKKEAEQRVLADEKRRAKLRSEGPGDALRTAGMSLGALSLILFCHTPAGVFFAVVGLVLGILGKKKGEEAGLTNMSNKGIVVPAVAAGINFFLIILSIVLRFLFDVDFQLHVINLNFGIQIH